MISRARQRGAAASTSNASMKLPAGKFRCASSATKGRKDRGRSVRRLCFEGNARPVHAGGFLHHLILINEDGSRTAP